MVSHGKNDLMLHRISSNFAVETGSENGEPALSERSPRHLQALAEERPKQHRVFYLAGHLDGNVTDPTV